MRFFDQNMNPVPRNPSKQYRCSRDAATGETIHIELTPAQLAQRQVDAADAERRRMEAESRPSVEQRLAECEAKLAELMRR